MNAMQNWAVSRRQFLATAGVAASAVWLAPRRLFAAEGGAEGGVVQSMRSGGASAAIEGKSLRGNVSVLIGSGGNIAVLPGSDGKLLIDAGLAGSQPQITKALAAISSNPVKHLVNTHWHFDHTDGNEWLHNIGAAIIAHENTRKHLSTSTRVEAWDFTFPPAPAGALPAKTIDKEDTLHLNDTTVELKYYGPSHTDGDLSAYFTDADVLHCGDTYWNGHYPFIDYSTGGSIAGMIGATEANLAKATARTIVIPGHGPVGDKKTLAEFRDMLVAIRDAVAAQKKQGKSVDEIIAAKPTAAYDTKWGTFVIDPATFTKLVFAGV